MMVLSDLEIRGLSDLWGEIQATPKGYCWFCQEPLKTKRQIKFCSKECFTLYYDNFFWQTAAKRALRRAHHKCEMCGISDSGYYKWQRDGKRNKPFLCSFEVHHIIPLQGEKRAWNILNWGGNLKVLCHECHRIIHAKNERKPDYEKVDMFEVARSKGQGVLNLYRERRRGNEQNKN